MNKLLYAIFFLSLTPIAFATNNSCDIKNINGVNFGSYNPLSSTVDNSVGSVTIKCDDHLGIIGMNTNNTAIIKLDKGVNSTTYFPRRMRNGSQFLNYNLYKDSGRLQVWGDGNNGTNTVTMSTNNNTQTFSIYGQIPQGQDVGIGNYADTIKLEVDF
jgi:spore coat protein U-like protein